MPPSRLERHLPAVGWLRSYRRADLSADLGAGFITAVLLIPQGLAYAMLAGLPAQFGLYASIGPPLVYALFGSSRTLSVGPVSVAALLVVHSLSESGAVAGSPAYIADALLLAFLTGIMLLAMAALRLGVLVNFLGHPVLAGFTSAAAVLIILSQLPPLLGLPAPPAGSALAMARHQWAQLGAWQPTVAAIGAASVLLLWLGRAPLARLLSRLGVAAGRAATVSRLAPLVVVALAGGLVWGLHLQAQGVQTVGAVPTGLPVPDLGFLNWTRARELLPAALLIALIAYLESVSVAKVLAYRRRERIDNNQELVAMGAANAAAAVTGGMPVAGSFSRSMVNYDAGARTQLAGVVAAILVALAANLAAPLFGLLPKAALAAVIVVAVAPLIDWRAVGETWRYDPAETAALLTTFVGVLTLGIEVGLVLGAAFAIGVFLWRSSRPHVAVVGRVPGTQHFRNVRRHAVETWPRLLLLRVDRSLFFANVSHVEDAIAGAVAAQPRLEHVVLLASGINGIDHSAVDSLRQLVAGLREAGVTLHLAEVKGPVMDRLRRSPLLGELAPGRVFLSAQEAVEALAYPWGS